jgi:hypothetical protein
MSESATAETAYFHTLTARPYFFPSYEDPDKRLSEVVARLPELPAEIRHKIFEHAFIGNRVAVTSRHGCYCASETTGPYRADHRWLLKHAPSGLVKREAQCVFIQTAMWELHCQSAMDALSTRMKLPNGMQHIRHIRLNVFELEAGPKIDLSRFSKLNSVTLCPWQKGWTIDVPEQAHSEALSDDNVMSRVWHKLESMPGYVPVLETFQDTTNRKYKMYFVFPIRFHLPVHAHDRLPRWQLRVWRACLDNGSIERSWKEVHLVQEATLD